jgi:hypothetical protein
VNAPNVSPSGPITSSTSGLEYTVSALVLVSPSVVPSVRGAGVNPAGKHGETDVLQEKGESLAGDRGRFGTLGGGVAAHEVGGRGETSGREELECFAGLES